ncbi:hypothetical protein [Halococcus hamelinensis]|uniref:DUF7991 domain-containing protein n=1 Tax=Halococcus hamelinensis 100A6 TaxID=1132509 RepID=M0LWZ8_9EURY|nr:hypothetical protein [Halococcus hamelinensis]EMA36620.1 hypothetical protein C447_15221 [Halococcus hamelinensis 100A6]
MVSVVDLVGLSVVVLVNTGIAAVGTRLLRVTLATWWGVAVYGLVLVPAVETAVALVLTGPVGLGPNLGTPTAVMALVVALPFALGVAIDFFWMPAPDEVDLPDGFDG